MKHLKKGKKFGRKTDQRKALLKQLSAQLILKEKIKTTLIKAKETQRTTEKLITLSKKQNLACFRALLAKLPEKAAQKLYYQLAPLYLTKPGGYTRIIKLAKPRLNDAAPMAYIELIK